jgi:hypothetical protein
MSTMSHSPTPESAMNAISRHDLPLHGHAAEGEPTSATMPARLQVIHDLIHSGGYHVPASAIADRMIEQLIVDKRAPKS